MNRRQFMTASAGLALSTGFMSSSTPLLANQKHPEFKLKYAPHFNMFKESAGTDLIDQLKFAADQGFRAWEDNRMKQRTIQEQEAIGKTMQDLKMEMGVFVAHGSIGKVTFTRKDEAVWDAVLKDLKDSLDVAKRVNAKWVTVVPRNVDETPRSRLAMGYQTANVTE